MLAHTLLLVQGFLLVWEPGLVLCPLPPFGSCFWNFCSWISSSPLLSSLGPADVRMLLKWSLPALHHVRSGTRKLGLVTFTPGCRARLWQHLSGLQGQDWRRRSACSCVTWVEEVVGKPSLVSNKANERSGKKGAVLVATMVKAFAHPALSPGRGQAF